MKGNRQDLIIAASLVLGGLGLYVVLAGSLGIHIPEIRLAEGWGVQIASTIAGLAILAFAFYLGRASIRTASATLALVTIAGTLIGLTLLGSRTGLPLVLVPFLDLVQAFADILNAIAQSLGAIGKAANGVGSTVQAIGQWLADLFR